MYNLHSAASEGLYGMKYSGPRLFETDSILCIGPTEVEPKLILCS